MENKYLLTYSDNNGNSFAWFDSMEEMEHFIHNCMDINVFEKLYIPYAQNLKEIN